MVAPPSPPGMDTADAVARVVRQAVGLLGGDAAGILLFGTQAATPVPRILDGVRALPLTPARFNAANGTVRELRAEVERVHAARPTTSTPLLLVVDEADRLGGTLLHELEQAAAAAAELGGLKFLFVSRHELADKVRLEELPALARCMEAGLRCDRAAIVPDAGERVYRQPAGPAAPPARLPRLLVAAGVLTLLAAVLVTGISHLRAPVVPPQVSPVATAPPGGSAMAPEPIPAPVPTPPTQPPAVVPAPVAPPPVEAPPPASALPTPATSAPPAPPSPAPASLLLIAGPGDTLVSLYARVYRGMVPPPFAQVVALNPAVVATGMRLRFPAPAAGWSPGR